MNIKPGQYFDKGSAQIYGFAGPPKKCVAVTKGRVYYVRLSDNPQAQAEFDEAKPEYCLHSSVGYVSDSLDEMWARFRLSNECHSAVERAISAVIEDYRARARRLKERPDVG